MGKMGKAARTLNMNYKHITQLIWSSFVKQNRVIDASILNNNIDAAERGDSCSARASATP